MITLIINEIEGIESAFIYVDFILKLEILKIA